MHNKGRLFLIPTTISEGTADAVLSPQLLAVLPTIGHFLAEDVRSARRFLSSLKIFPAIEHLSFEVLNKDTEEASIPKLMLPLTNGLDMGLLSEAGCPGVADPGSLAVAYAHRTDVQVVPLVGPSSILLALMASGLNGQNFSFNGYLPIDQDAFKKAVRELERESAAKGRTQIFIETPYRNDAMVKRLLAVLSPDTRLCIAIGVTGKDEQIRTRTVKDWKTGLPALGKSPAVFLFLAKR